MAVIGAIKQGKSTLINSILDYKINNETGKYPDGAAIVEESGSTTKIRAPYSNPLLEGIVVWDMPGIDGFSHKMDEYLDDFEINSDKFDFFVVVISGEITTDATYLIRELYKRQMPFYLVRTHVDETIRKGKRLMKEERDVLNGVQGELHQQLHLVGQSFEPINGSVTIKYQLFLVGGLERDRYDMKKLLEDIEIDLPQKTRQILLRKIQQCWRIILRSKREQIQKDSERAIKSCAMKQASLFGGKARRLCTLRSAMASHF